MELTLLFFFPLATRYFQNMLYDYETQINIKQITNLLLGGQEQYRTEWSRYTKGCDVVLYVVDAAAPQKFVTAKKELHKLLDDGSIGNTPLLVLANKIDIPEHAAEQELIEKLQLNYVLETPWMVLPISALHTTNIDQVVEWLTSQGR